MDGRPDPVYKAGYAVCLSCLARETRMQEVRDHDEKSGKKNVHESARHWVVLRDPK